MSTLSSMLSSSLSLFFPAQCLACGEPLVSREEWVCTSCYASMATTYFHLDRNNRLAERLRSSHPTIVNATSQFYYINNGRWREVIHQIKYRHSWLSARKMGFWYGSELLESPLYQDIDLIVPIPLHRTRLLERRYNQSEKIAEGISKAMGCPLERHALRRLRNNPSQVTRTRRDRWKNVEKLFAVNHPDRLRGKHLLLVDDVFTTGSTILACVDSLTESALDCRISIATIAVSRNEVFGNAL